ncbi:hypothetical protein TVAG_275670 [Trichomonas vaginalis G3]|uniref:Vps16 N-terminal domain-containing protein n=1 Tax=Trichomonas vaginalis (strain ATCC PRA-98 / G3) TaxID=412133 RepID=A2EYE0_TRIV3|nr:vacuolar protein sorting VPSs16 family [Trichomonas vaginalis G3]EAY02293.1 hypothetical protein TVAG_275670 [Trichomonas vaginalis G3]KAI5500876.1 vacuolar protein sorting VPSs16 family [Trichomonas vaginalis G3]|eukprot:XP_001314608.1 hypothetical protein [Trichomonas vaginalis G3]
MEKMESLFDTSNLTIDDIKTDFEYYESMNALKLYMKNVWKTEPAPISQYFAIIAGGTNGNNIAYTRVPSLSSTRHAIDVYNHKLQKVETYINTDTCNRAYMHYNLEGHLFFFAANGISNTITEYFNSCIISTYEFETTSEVVFCQMLDYGCVCITDDYKVYFVEKYNNMGYLFSLPEVSQYPYYAIVEPRNSANDQPIVYIGDGNKLYACSITGTVTMELPKPVTRLSLSPRYDFISIGLGNDEIAILKSDLGQDLVLRIDCDLQNVTYFGWLGDSIPLVISGNQVYLYDVYKMSTYFDVGPDPIFINCGSYAMIFSQEQLTILSELGSSSFECISADTPAGKLCRAYDKRSSVEVNNIKPKLSDAVKSCISAAMECCFDVDKQKYFLAAAVFGNFQLESPIDIDFTILCLRISNSLRNDLFLCSGYEETERLIRSGSAPMRYCAFGQFGRASKVCELIGSRPSRVVTEWCRRIMISRTSDDNDSILRLFKTKLNSGLNPTDVAFAARRLNNPELAKSVGLLERFLARIVNLWLEEGLWEDALQAATDSMDDTILVPLLQKCINANGEEYLQTIISKNKNLYYAIERVFGDYPDNPLTVLLKKTEVSKETSDITVRRRVREMGFPASAQTTAILNDIDHRFDLPYVQHMVKMVKFCDDLYQYQGYASRNLPFNQAIVEEAAVDIDAALDKCEKTGFSKERSIQIIARGFIKKNDFVKLERLTADKYGKFHINIIKTVYLLKGKEQAQKFVNMILDKKRNLEATTFLNEFNENEWDEDEKYPQQSFFTK